MALTTYPFCGHCGWDIQRVDDSPVGTCDACGAHYDTYNAITIADTATAGVPGTWNGQRIPNTLAEAQASAITASPGTAWTVGQNVVLGDGSTMHWNGSAWAAGAAT